jgi:transposase
MAPTLRGQRFHTPSPEPLANKEATTTKKCRFFDALSRDSESKSQRQISKECGIGETTGRTWKKQFENMSSLAKRRTLKRSAKLGRRSKVSKSTCKMLVSPSRNPVRKHPYEVQLEFHQIPVKKRQLQYKLKEHTNGGQRYKYAFVKKVISDKNLDARESYGRSTSMTLSLDFGTISSLQTKHTLTQRRNVSVTFYEKEERGMTTRTLRKGRRSRASGFTLQHGLIGMGKHLN